MDDSTTDEHSVSTGVDETLPEDTNDESAEQHTDANSTGGDSHDDSGNEDDGNDDDPKGQSSNTDNIDPAFAKFAKSKGYDPANLTDGERRALKIAHDTQKEFTKKRQEEANALRDTVADLHDPKKAEEGIDDEYEKREARRDAKIAQLEAYQRVNEFWRQNPDAKDYEADMNRLVKEERETNGLESAYYLSRDLSRLYKLARADSQDPDTLREAGRRQEREELRRKQEGSADRGSASSPAPRTNGKVDANWIENTYDPSKPEHRKMLDDYFAKQS